MKIITNAMMRTATFTLCLLGCTSSFSVLPKTSRHHELTLSKTQIAASTSNVVSVSSPQLLEFREPRTNVTVILVGAMHYNPTSVRLAEETVDDLGLSNRLGSVVIESCDIRWNKTGELYDESPVMKEFLKNEMRTACDTAIKYKRPVILGDQRINITTTAIKEGFKQTFTDLANPVSGWKRFVDQVSDAVELALPGGPGYLNAFGILQSRLLLTAPVSFIKYPVSFLYRSPLFTAVFLTLLAASSIEPSSAGVEDITFTDTLPSLAFSVLETVVFFRLLTKELLAERNDILARNIYEQCLIYSKNKNGASNKSNDSFFGLQLPFSVPAFPNTKSAGYEIVYAEDYMANSVTRNNLFGSREDTEEKVVVAVLGMAHCNGIKKLLEEELI